MLVLLRKSITNEKLARNICSWSKYLAIFKLFSAKKCFVEFEKLRMRNDMDNFSLCTTNPLTVIADRFILGWRKTFLCEKTLFCELLCRFTCTRLWENKFL